MDPFSLELVENTLPKAARTSLPQGKVAVVAGYGDVGKGTRITSLLQSLIIGRSLTRDYLCIA